jgi:signal transduction histidine kinase
MHEGGVDGASPLPGVDQIADLVESVRRAGTPVELEVVGETGSLTGTGGLTVYRILQEALTNVARHAAGAPTTVRVEVAEGGETRLTVDSAGTAGRTRPGALGIVSMQERAEALGGRLTAGPGGPGWRVEAVLPG